MNLTTLLGMMVLNGLKILALGAFGLVVSIVCMEFGVPTWVVVVIFVLLMTLLDLSGAADGECVSESDRSAHSSHPY